MKKKMAAMTALAISVKLSIGLGATLVSPSQKLSYSMGFETGKAMRSHHVELDQNAYALGMKEGLAGKAVSMSEKEVKATLVAFQKDAMEKFKHKMSQELKSNLKTGQQFLEKNKSKKGVVVMPSGLQYLVIKKGSGPIPTLQDKVTVDYKGMLINGKVFDSSYARGKKSTFPVSAVIKGWQQALTMMPVGSVWKVFVPADLAYGTQGAPGAIGPNETLIFEIHLYSINK